MILSMSKKRQLRAVELWVLWAVSIGGGGGCGQCVCVKLGLQGFLTVVLQESVASQELSELRGVEHLGYVQLWSCGFQECGALGV